MSPVDSQSLQPCSGARGKGDSLLYWLKFMEVIDTASPEVFELLLSLLYGRDIRIIPLPQTLAVAP